jgi:hypothetical protein
VPKEYFNFLLVYWRFQVEDYLYLSHVDFDTIFAYNMSKKNTNWGGKDAFLDIQR